MLSIDLTTLLSHLAHLVAAWLIVMPIAWERERATRIMGLRTFPLVALGTCAFVLIGTSMAGDNGNAKMRLIEGIITGLGFIGGGAILKEGNGNGVRGTATAASIWTTGAAGIAIGFSQYAIAVVIVVLTFVILRWLSSLKEQVEGMDESDKA
ncbi:MAG: MgtC/SapB family protein [Caldilineaceae bacterium]